MCPGKACTSSTTWVVRVAAAGALGPAADHPAVREALLRGAILYIGPLRGELLNDNGRELVKRMGEIVDGQYQKYAVESGAYIRQHFWGVDPRLLDMVKHLTDDQLRALRLGGHVVGVELLLQARGQRAAGVERGVDVVDGESAEGR